MRPLPLPFCPAALLRRFRRPAPPPLRHVAHYQGVLGTRLEVQLLAASAEVGEQATAAVLAEIERLERVFSRFDAGSELNRWQADPAHLPSAELAELLRRAEGWRVRTGGAFHPGCEALTLLWQAAQGSGQPPSSAALARVLAQLEGPVWAESVGWRPALPLNLNAFAKGYIVDRAVQSAQLPGVAEVLVNIGGDLRHWAADEHGTCSPGVPVSVMDPLAPHDNAAPLTTLRLRSAGLATSGGALRGAHLQDPRTGHPSTAVLSATVLAPTCADADALATALSVLDPAHSLALTESLAGVECLLVDRGGRVQRSCGFPT